MAIMFDICRKPTSSDSLIRVYENECVINSSAAILIGLGSREITKVKFTYDEDELRLHNRRRLYVSGYGNDAPRGFVPKRRGKSYRIYSKELCRSLADNLEGYGVYRICPEVAKNIEGKTYYEIFFKKYE